MGIKKKEILDSDWLWFGYLQTFTLDAKSMPIAYVTTTRSLQAVSSSHTRLLERCAQRAEPSIGGIGASVGMRLRWRLICLQMRGNYHQRVINWRRGIDANLHGGERKCNLNESYNLQRAYHEVVLQLLRTISQWKWLQIHSISWVRDLCNNGLILRRPGLVLVVYNVITAWLIMQGTQLVLCATSHWCPLQVSVSYVYADMKVEV